MDEASQSLVKYRLAKAMEELELAELCLDSAKYSKSLNCSYYAIFHSTRSLLATEKKDFRKHSAVISYFIKNYVQMGKFDEEFARIIKSSESDRNKSDYHDFFIVTKEEAETQLKKAKYFVTTVKNYLKNFY